MKQHLLKFAASLHKIIALFKIYVVINKESEYEGHRQSVGNY